MKRTIILTIAVLIAITSVTEAKTREYAGGLIRVTTYRQPHYRPYYRPYHYGYYGSYRGYGHYDSGGIKYSDAKEGLKIQSDFFTTLITGGRQVDDVIEISREARETPKLTTQEMDQWAKKIKVAQEEKQEKAANEKLRQEVEKLELELKKARLEKELKMLQPNDPNE